jgi:hypothetical protein
MIVGCLECALLFGAGAFLAWRWPRRVRREVESGDISEQQGREKLRRFSPMLGYLVMTAATLLAIAQFL